MDTLKSIRLENKISQVEAAKILHISRRSYQMYENMSESNYRYDYYLERLKKHFYVDEEHGIVSLDTIISKSRPIFEKYNCRFAYLFGSYAKGYQTGKSDIDIFVDTDTTGLDFFALIEDLRVALHKVIDLLDLHSVVGNEDLMREILLDGIKIYESK